MIFIIKVSSFLFYVLIFCCYFVGPPTPPTQLFAIETQSHSVTIGWEHPEFFDVDIYYVEIWDNSSKKWENATTVPGQQNSATLADLEPETTYNITMYGENQYGVGALKSNALQVKTKKGISIFKIITQLPIQII